MKARNFELKYSAYTTTRDIKNPKVSVIVPCYNSEAYLEDCIVSLLKQTFTEAEIICVNDGATDSTPQILEEFAKLDSRIKIITQPNGGLSCARNTGVKNAKGKYITFIDSDDWVSENYLDKLYTSITKNVCDIAVSEMVRKRPKSEKYRLHFEEEKVFETLQDKVDICKIPDCCYVCGKLFRRELIENRPFKSGVYFEDVIWTPGVLKEAKKIVVVPETYYYYRVNPGSIVKTVQSIQKQHDSYVAKSYIVKFFEENNLVLSEKNKHVTKYISYLFGVPVLKTKEYGNVETTLLLGFLPVFRRKKSLYYKFKKNKSLFLFKNLDSHIYINIFGIHMGFKINQKFNYKWANEKGVTEEKREPQLIVSLTSFPERIVNIHKTISTLLNQTLKPDRVILWLAQDQFKNKEKDLTEKLLELKKQGLEIRWCEDLKSYKKLVPALREFPEDIIVTADDDLYYQEDWLESLYSEYLKDSKNIYTRRACRVEKDGKIFKISPHYSNNHYASDFSNQLMGGAGTLFPPHSLHEDVLDTDLIKTLIPTFDDIYFWAMAVLAGTKIGLVKNKDLNLYNVEDTQEIALCKINGQSSRMNDREAFNRIFDKYPEIIRRI